MEVFNLKFVGEVEKHPPLYNYIIPDYCRKDLVDKAWQAVSMEVKLPGKYFILYVVPKFFRVFYMIYGIPIILIRCNMYILCTRITYYLYLYYIVICF
jgi:hypothetical protein